MTTVAPFGTGDRVDDAGTDFSAATARRRTRFGDLLFVAPTWLFMLAVGVIAILIDGSVPVYIGVLTIVREVTVSVAVLVLAALGALSAVIAVLVTIGLFRVAGPKRTRLIAQIIAGIVGAGFIIGIQAMAILSFGNLNRFEVLQSPQFVAAAPVLDSLVWLPARAAMGDLGSLALLLVLSLAVLAVVIAAPRA